MSTTNNMQHQLEDVKVNVKIKLAALWTCFMFLYIYVDYYHLYMPDALNQILAGKVFVFDITWKFLVIALISTSIPALMIFLSVVLPAKVNRVVSITIAMIYVPYTLFNLAGDAWIHMIFGAAVEVTLLALIIRYSWKWPRA